MYGYVINNKLITIGLLYLNSKNNIVKILLTMCKGMSFLVTRSTCT